MRGRRAKPAALREAQGNPGKRKIAAPMPKTDSGDKPDQVAAPAPDLSSLVDKLTDDARKVYELIGPQLRAINFLRPTDEGAFRRYCETLARYWRVTQKLNDLGGETYECATTNGGTMQRMRPEFMVQERLAKRLDTQEDRFGLNPMARQQYILALQRQPQLPLDPPAPKQGTDDAKNAAAPLRPPPIGGQRAQVH